MAAILYRDADTYRRFEDDEVPQALENGWYWLTVSGHPVRAPQEPPIEAPVTKKPGRPKKVQE